jgi:hypothetical protein
MDRRRRARLLAGASAALLAGYLSYRAYHSEALQERKRALTERMERAVVSIQRYGEALGNGAEVLAILTRDLLAFLTSDRDEVRA